MTKKSFFKRISNSYIAYDSVLVLFLSNISGDEVSISSNVSDKLKQINNDYDDNLVHKSGMKINDFRICNKKLMHYLKL